LCYIVSIPDNNKGEGNYMDELNKRVNEWFGLDENWGSNAQVSHSFHNQLRKLDKQIEKLSKRKGNELKIETLRSKYQKLFEEGPRWN
jgi:hypothetical protein